MSITDHKTLMSIHYPYRLEILKDTNTTLLSSTQPKKEH